MPSAAWSVAPVQVSPLIRLSRWMFLGAGIFWGVTRHQFYSVQENALRAKLEEERPAREAAQKAENDARAKEEMDYLLKEAGVIPGGSSKGGGAPPEDHKHGVGCGCMNK